jgi:hypothetical protein
MQQLQGYGNAEQSALQQSYQNAMGTGMQSLASSGLAGTSIAPSMRMGYMKQYQQSLNSLNQSLQQMKLGAESTFGLGGIQSEQAQQQISNQLMLGKGNEPATRIAITRSGIASATTGVQSAAIPATTIVSKRRVLSGCCHVGK